MNRRDFLKIVGITTATSTAALYGCGSKEGSSEGSKGGFYQFHFLFLA